MDIKARARDELEVLIYGDIGDAWSAEATTAKRFADELKAAGAVSRIRLRFNSEGGSVFDAVAIHSLLKSHQARVEAVVDGLAASAASVVLMAADDIAIAPGAFVMIHQPWTGAGGDARKLRQLADRLDQVAQQMVDIYARRTRQPRETIWDWMNAETWMDADAAVTNRFADRLLADEPAMRLAARVTRPERYRKVPAALRLRPALEAARARLAALQRPPAR